jgi:hypothetical protein
MDQDSTYYLQRAETELSMAQAADHPAAIRAHYFLAGFYLDRAHAASPALTVMVSHPHVIADSGEEDDSSEPPEKALLG